VVHVSNRVRPLVVAGDWHGDLQWARHVIRAAHAAGANTILHVGDLGVLWPGRGKGRFDAKLDRYLDGLNVDLLFADGNHDNHAELRALEVGPDGLAAVLPRIKYLPRAGRAVVQGIRIGALGGAYSVDHPSRKPGIDWWPGIEEVAPEDVEKLIAGGPLDVLLAHDVPAAVDMQSKRDDLDPGTVDRAQVSRYLLQKAVDALRPPNVFSGHWHTRKTDFVHHAGGENTRVDVLDMDGSRDGNAVLVWPGHPLRIEPLTVGGGRG
jgi:predicted phosphodiesterase